MKIVRASVIAAGAVVVTAGEADSEEWTPEVQALAEKAREHYEARRFKEAEATSIEALKRAPTNPHLLSTLGVIQFQAKKYQLAEETLTKAIKAAPEDEFAHTTLGIVYYSQGKLDAASDALTKALAINSNNASAHNYLGAVASKNGLTEVARNHAEIAATLEASDRDSTFREPAFEAAPLGDFLTPLEKSRLNIPSGTYLPVQPPGEATRRQ